MNYIFIPLDREPSSLNIVSSSSNPSCTGLLPLGVAASIWKGGTVNGPWMIPIAVLAVSSGSSTSTCETDPMMVCASPYSRIEKRARQVYAGLHNGRDAGNTFPVMLATSDAGMNSVRRLFKERNVKNITETLDVLERLLADR